MTHIQVQNWKQCVSYVPEIHTSHTKHTMHGLFSVCSNHTTFNTVDKNKKNKLFAAYDSDTSVALKQVQRHETWYELIDLKQGDNHVKFERPPLNSVHKKSQR